MSLFTPTCLTLTLAALLAGPLLVQAAAADAAAAEAGTAPSADKVANKEPFAAAPFEPWDVRLLDGPFKENQDRATKYLLDLRPDRLLSGFRTDAGLKPKARRYDGWELRGVAGHSLGHYLSGISYAYAATGNQEFKDRAAYIVAELAECQKANGNGYVSAIPEGKRIFAEVARGDIHSQGFDLNGAWVPWYTTHKVFAGLIDAYELTGNTQARDVVTKLADWAIDETKGLSDEQFQRMLNCEQGGMNEALAHIYAITGDEKYLKLSRRFNHHAILDPLAQQHDELAGKHANTQVPKVIGTAVQYELTGDAWAKSASMFFWQTVTKNHSYVTGGNSDGEHFGEPGKLADRLGENTTETCNTYNMLKLTRHLYEWSADAKYADYYERAVINHILASQDPDTAGVTYYCTLHPGSSRSYQTPFESFTCCVGTGMENHVKYNAAIYFHKADTLFVSQFIASELHWAKKGLTLRQETRFPEQQSTKVTLELKQPTELSIKFRHPAWVSGDAKVTINGKPAEGAKVADGYITLTRTWKGGDVIELALPMALHTEAMPDDADRIAVLYGPIVLAGKLTPEQAETIPAFVESDKTLSDWIKPVDGKPLTFRTEGAAKPADVTLIPYFQAHHGPATVYFDRFTAAQWAAKAAEYRAEQERQQRILALTVDTLGVGEMQAERDHNVDGQHTRVGELNGRKWRDAGDGGAFSFDLKTDPNTPQRLILTYWGSDGGARAFDILIDTKKLASESLEGKTPGKFVEVEYDLPPEMTRGKDHVRVTLAAKPGNIAGGIFGAKMVRKE